MATQRYESSVTAVSWIPSEAITGPSKIPFELGVTHYDEPPPDRIDDIEALRTSDRFREAIQRNQLCPATRLPRRQEHFFLQNFHRQDKRCLPLLIHHRGTSVSDHRDTPPSHWRYKEQD